MKKAIKNHTPGPWFKCNMDVDVMPYRIASFDYGVCAVYGASGGKSESGNKVANKKEAAANARLIAAAPEMLDALEKLVSEILRIKTTGIDLFDAQRAIKKAKGHYEHKTSL